MDTFSKRKMLYKLMQRLSHFISYPFGGINKIDLLPFYAILRSIPNNY